MPTAPEHAEKVLSWLRRHRLAVADWVALVAALGVVARFITPLPLQATASALAAAAMLPMGAPGGARSRARVFLSGLPRRLIFLAAVGIAWVYFFRLPARCLWLGPIWIGMAWIASLDWRPFLVRVGAALAWAEGRRSPRAETGLRIVLLAAISVWLMRGFDVPFLPGSGDAGWYGAVLRDTVEQARAGVFPIWAGQSAYQFNGAISPVRIAPAFNYAGAALDAATFHSLGHVALLNTMIILFGIAGTFCAYLCLGALLPGRRWLAFGLAVLFMACPGVLGIAYNGDLYMSWMALPLLPFVFLGTVLTFRLERERLGLLMIGTSLGLCWWAHAPIALWATLLCACAQAARLTLRGRWTSSLGILAAAGLVFASIAAFPIGSVLLYPTQHGVNLSAVQLAHPRTITSFLADAFPAALLPMSAAGRSTGDVQLGYALWALLLFLLCSRFRGAPLEVRVLLVSAAALALLLLPLPGLGTMAWELVPAFIRNPTGNWVAPRLYPLLAAATVFAAACGPAGKERRGALLAALVAGGSLWSLLEASKFAEESRVLALDPASLIDRIAPENLQLTRYSYGMFPRLPSTFTHGVTDPLLENHLLDPGTSAPILENAKAALASSRLVASAAFVKRHHGDADFIELDNPFHIEPGKSYLLQLVIQRQDYATGVLQIKGREFFREYGLPEHGGPRAFGVGGDHQGAIPLWTTKGYPEDLMIRFFPSAPVTFDQGLRFASEARLLSYETNALPIQVESWIPYSARVRSPSAALLETPRMFQPGYAARVDGAEAAVSKSPDGLVCVAVPAGESHVEVTYVPPAGLRLLFWLSFLSIACAAAASVAGLCAVLLGIGRFRKPPPTAPA